MLLFVHLPSLIYIYYAFNYLFLPFFAVSGDGSMARAQCLVVTGIAAQSRRPESPAHSLAPSLVLSRPTAPSTPPAWPAETRGHRHFTIEAEDVI